MRFSTITLAFLFFTTVFATPIFRAGADNNISLAKRTKTGVPSRQSTMSGTRKPKSWTGGPKSKTSKSKPSTGGPKSKTSHSKLSTSGPKSKTSQSKPSTGRPKSKTSKSKSNTSAGRGKKTPCNGKRATPTELQAALHPNNIGQTFSLSHAEWRRVYKLKSKVDGKEAIVKISIIVSEDELEDVEREVTALKANHQFIGWGHSRDKKVFYIVMEYMGVPLEKTPEAFKGDTAKVTEAKKATIARYKQHFGLIHTDSWTPELGEQDENDDTAGLSNESNWTYRQVGGQWQGELIDWDFYEAVEGHELARADESTALDLGCGVFVPPELEKNI
ncbi:hypothetical protein F5887DRAFT_1282947 [Amanita rubescens]|nr:hypothetical protein F5887DRAFT_1282947 [Amanita rubescens]